MLTTFSDASLDIGEHESTDCFRLRTGKPGCHALFHPGRYLLTLQDNEQCRRIELGYSGSRLLECLLRAPGEVVSRDTLLQFAWADRVVSQGSLNQQIYTLRQVLGDEQARDIIQTLPRRGYQLNPNAVLPDRQPQQPTPALPQQPAIVAAQGVSMRRQPARWSSLCLLAASAAMLVVHLSRAEGIDQQEFATIDGLDVRYLAATQTQRTRLIRETLPALKTLATLSGSLPTTVTVSANGEFIQLLCHVETSGRGRWLEAHRASMATLPAETLQHCLP